jgi:molecular chaperone HscB
VANPARNYFDLFDLPVCYALDPHRLAERYRAAQASADGDALESVHQDAARAAPSPVMLDEAYRTLNDPLARAEYLIALHASDAAAAEAEDGGRDGGPDGAFLIEQLELNEVLAEASNRSQPQGAVAEVLTEMAERSAVLSQELEHLFANPSPGNLDDARKVVRKLRLIERCRKDAHGLQSPPGSGRPGPRVRGLESG